MLNSVFPKRIETPKIELGISLGDGLDILCLLEGEVIESCDKEHSYRVNSPEFDLAIYETDGIVSSIWFNDPVGRIWAPGKARKIYLYLKRYGDLEDWDLREDNSWMRHYFNDKSNAAMVYGVHNDVIRFNAWQAA